MVNLNKLYNSCKTVDELNSFFTEGMLMFDFFEEKNAKVKKEKNGSDEQEKKNQFQDRYINTQIQVDDFINGREQIKKATNNKNSSKKISESRHSPKRKIKLPNFRTEGVSTPSDGAHIEDELFEIEFDNSSDNKSIEKKNGSNFQFEKTEKKNGLNNNRNQANDIKKHSWSFKLSFGKHSKSENRQGNDIKKVEKNGEKHQNYKFKIHKDNPKIAETITLQQKTNNFNENENNKLNIEKKPKKWRKSKEEKLQKKQKVNQSEEEHHKKSECQEGDKSKKHSFFKRKNEKSNNSDVKSKEYDTDMGQLVAKEDNVAKETPILDDEIRKMLSITDELLGKLPEEVIDEFAQSEDFKLYEKVMSKYKIK